MTLTDMTNRKQEEHLEKNPEEKTDEKSRAIKGIVLTERKKKQLH